MALNEYIQKEIEKFTGVRNIKTNPFRMRTYDSIMNEFFGLDFLSFYLILND